MCGIIGIVGERPVADRLIEGLRRLEYRGYDSAGIAVVQDGALRRRRAPGKLRELEAVQRADPVDGTTGVGHTRWATHGGPTQANAHPHVSGRVALVHNGIIENFAELKAELQAQGRRFESETDSEVVAQLLDHELEGGASPHEAFKATLARLRGAYALAVLVKADGAPTLLGARLGPPLVVGHGEGEMFIGSDPLAVAPYTQRVTYLEDGDHAVVTAAGAQVFDAHGRPADRPMKVVPLSAAQLEKGEYRHFMEKEIHEQPDAVQHTLSAYVDPVSGRAQAPGIDFAATPRIQVVACGTAYLAGLTAKYLFERLAGLPVDVEIASEFRYRDPAVTPGTLALAISQSGETADTLAALRWCKQQGLSTAAVVNAHHSSMAREADVMWPTHAGPEIGVASTKAFTAQIAALTALAIAAAFQRGRIDAAEEARLIALLMEAPRLIAEALQHEDEVIGLAGDLSRARDVLYLGRGPLYPLALEGALKLKELSYIHAEGYAAGELKHGPIALVDEHMPVVVAAPSGELLEKTLSNLQEVAARGGAPIILISDARGLESAHAATRTIQAPDCDPLVAPLVYAVPLQLLAYHVAVAKGTDVDQPRNLAKSVTVE
ncbi:MAG: glutamine--fructose-6-phosphate transaminase (isomerizing) [Caulobacteraceae bacterium]|nr:glutamine--fructose-6-phosphate transaminase (isomerizing) [Caulobacter sp.]